MAKVADKPKRRHTTSTNERVQRLVNLAERLIESPMDQHEISAFLGFSPSGARTYTRQLVDAGVAHAGARGNQNLQLIAIHDADYARRYIAHLIDEQQAHPTRAAKKKLPPPPPPGVHLLGDDVPFQPRRRQLNAPVARDPLVSALFGDGPARKVVYDDHLSDLEYAIMLAQQPEPPETDMTLTISGHTTLPPPLHNPWIGGRIDWSAA
jgi:hypothetical protein